MTREVMQNEEFLQSIIARTPSDRVGDPVDVAQAALFLASDEARFITGSSLIVDGGVPLEM